MERDDIDSFFISISVADSTSLSLNQDQASAKFTMIAGRFCSMYSEMNCDQVTCLIVSLSLFSSVLPSTVVSRSLS